MTDTLRLTACALQNATAAPEYSAQPLSVRRGEFDFARPDRTSEIENRNRLLEVKVSIVPAHPLETLTIGIPNFDALLTTFPNPNFGPEVEDHNAGKI